MRVIYLSDTIDCTSDPHPVSYRAALENALDDVVKVCASSLVKNVRSVSLEFGKERFESDSYTDTDIKGKPPAKGDLAEKYKIVGLHFSFDADVDAKHHLPIGMEGVKAAVEIVRKRFKKRELPTQFSIGVLWAFAGSASCSDYITPECSDPSHIIVNYDNQDWWTSNKGYPKHCKDLSDLIRKNITPRTGE